MPPECPPAAPRAERTGETEMPGQATPSAAASGEDWCLLELESFQLTGWSPAFAAHLAVPDLAPPVHLLTALADPALLAAVAGAVDDPSPEAVRPVEGRPVRPARPRGRTPARSACGSRRPHDPDGQ